MDIWECIEKVTGFPICGSLYPLKAEKSLPRVSPVPQNRTEKGALESQLIKRIRTPGPYRSKVLLIEGETHGIKASKPQSLAASASHNSETHHSQIAGRRPQIAECG